MHVAYDTADSCLSIMAEALRRQVEGTGIDLLSLHREGSTLTARINDAEAEEPLCPAAFDRVVRRLSYQLLGEVWSGRVIFEPTAAPIPQNPAPLGLVA